MPFGTPAKIGKYDVLDIIGRGGMGVVYKGNDPFLNRLVAIKMMTENFSDNPDQLKRFFREAQSTGSLQHPNIVTVYDLGDHNGTPYFVMEYLEGESLDAIIEDRRPLHLLEKLNLILGVCHGLSYAHRRSIVHRDIKPGNVMVVRDGGVKIVDFGIAHIGGKNATRTGQVMGSINYMSPEQINGKLIDARTDIFSTAVVLYQLVSYALPFDGETTAATLLRILHEPPTPLKNFLASYPPELEAILLRALAKEREARYQSVDAFALDLAQLQTQLKQEMVSRRMREATAFVEQDELYKAKDKLLKVLELDRHHTQANQLLREVQQRIRAQEQEEQLQRLKAQADEACSREHFDDALGYLDRAIKLTPNSTELLQQRESVQEAAVRLQKLQSALKRAESAHRDLDLDVAKLAAEEALEIAPGDTHAKALHRLIQRDWEERSRQRQVESYLNQARQEISLRRFTAALEVLSLAETLEPGGPQIRALRESATVGQEQERRRRELEAITRQIEDALNRDDYETAFNKAEQGLERFPEDRALLKLKMLAEKQRHATERKHLIDQQLASARQLLEEGRSEELLADLETALAKFGPEPRLESLQVIVRENVQRERIERRKAGLIKEAQEALRRKSYAEAIRILTARRAEFQDAAEIDDLLQFAHEEETAEKHRLVAEQAAQKAHALIAQQEYAQAISLLEATLREVPDEELRLILAEAQQALELQKNLESTLAASEQLFDSGKPAEAVQLIEAHPALVARSPELQKLLQAARREAERLLAIQQALEAARRASHDENYLAAVRVLEECREKHGNARELENEIAEAHRKRLEKADKVIQEALEDARPLLQEAQYQAAIDRLARVGEPKDTISPEVWSEYQALQHQASTGAASQRERHIKERIAAGELTKAAELLRQTVENFSAIRNWSDLEKLLRHETARRTDAQRALGEAQVMVRKAAWKQAGELLTRAYDSAEHFPALREQTLNDIVQAAQSAVEADWRAAEYLLQLRTELKGDAPPAEALRGRIEERKREEFVTNFVAQVARLSAAGNLQGSLDELARGLATYPEEPRLVELQNSIRESIRQEEEKAAQEKALRERENFVREASLNAQREVRLDHRIALLEQALERYPDEAGLQQQLREARDLWKQVGEHAGSAGAHEQAERYDAALQEWNALRSIYPGYPDIESNVARVTQLHEAVRARAKASWVERLSAALAAMDYERGGSLLAEATREFAADADLEDLKKKLQEGVKARGKAENRLTDAQEAFHKQQWAKGANHAKRGCAAAPQDLLVQEHARTLLIEATESALENDLASAEMLLTLVAELPTDSAVLSPLRSQIEQRKRDQMVDARLAAVAKLRAAKDLQSALGELEEALRTFPEEARLLQAKQEVEGQLRQIEEEQRREAERKREEEQKKELERQRELERQKAEAARKREEEERQRQEEQQRAEAARLQAARLQEEARQREEELRRQRELEHQRELQRQEEQRKKERLERERLAAEAEKRQRAEAARRQAEEERRHKEAAALRAAELAKDKEGIQEAGGPGLASPAPLVGQEPEASASTMTSERQGASLAAEPLPSRFLLLVPRATRNIAVVACAAIVVGAIAYFVHKPHPAPQPVLVRVEVGTAPQNASITIKRAGQADHTCVTPNCSLNLAPGDYQIEVRHEGYQALTQSLHVGGPNPTSLALQLIPESLPSSGPTTARLELSGIPSGTEVVVDGALVGKTNRKGTFSSEVMPGDHQVGIVTKTQGKGEVQSHFTAGEMVSLRKNDFSLRVPASPLPTTTPLPATSAVPPAPTPNVEETDWQKAVNAPSIGSLEEFLRQHPSSTHGGDANSRLEDLYWAQDKRDNTVAAYHDYLSRYPSGKFSQPANDAIESLDFQAVQSTNDPAVVENFLNSHPNGKHRREARDRLDDLSWARTNSDDLKSLNAYLAKFGNGRHAGEATKALAKLTPVSPPPPPASIPAIDESHSVLALVNQYQKAYEDRNVNELKSIWPGMSQKQVNGVQDFFNTVDSVTLTYDRPNVQLNGNDAVVKFSQSLSYTDRKGKAVRNTSPVIMKLKRVSGTQGALGSWQIESIR